ncbi:hypothetical protein MRX96_016037 [Rhipicephalus microplus]
MTSPSETENSAGTAPPAKAEKPAETPVTQETAASPTSDATTTAASAPANKPSVHKTDYDKDVVYLYQFTRCPTLPGISPFCLKVETWLRMTQVKYENVDHKLKFKSKKGSTPVCGAQRRGDSRF